MAMFLHPKISTKNSIVPSLSLKNKNSFQKIPYTRIISMLKSNSRYNQKLTEKQSIKKWVHLKAPKSKSRKVNSKRKKCVINSKGWWFKNKGCYPREEMKKKRKKKMISTKKNLNYFFTTPGWWPLFQKKK